MKISANRMCSLKKIHTQQTIILSKQRHPKKQPFSFCFMDRHRDDNNVGLSVAESIDIEAPIEVVWTIISNVANYATVLQDTTMVRPLHAYHKS